MKSNASFLYPIANPLPRYYYNFTNQNQREVLFMKAKDLNDLLNGSPQPAESPKN